VRATGDGAAVIYARTFTISYASLGLGPEWVPEDPQTSPSTNTSRVCATQVYPHTDDTYWRMVADVRSLIGGAGQVHGVWSASMPDDWVADVAVMVERQRDRFKREARTRDFRATRTRRLLSATFTCSSKGISVRMTSPGARSRCVSPRATPPSSTTDSAGAP
jgi:hypothetical protein